MKKMGALALATVLTATPAFAASPIKHVFVIAFENHNWTQPRNEPIVEQIKDNPAAPYINSLCDPKSPNSAQASCAGAYHNVLATRAGKNAHIHPSEPNYIWAEAGSNLGVANDDEPYGPHGTAQTTNATLSAQLMRAHLAWLSYQEDIDVDYHNGELLPASQHIVPLVGEAGRWSAVNPYNGSHLYNYEPKHNPAVFFAVSNGGNNPAPSNRLAAHYRPLSALMGDLNSGDVAAYNWITPDMYNDMHNGLPGGFTYHGTHYDEDQAAIAEGDNFAAKIVPIIMASRAYRDGGAIILWWDETEGTGDADNFAHTLPEIVISPYAKGHGYTSKVNLSHSSDLKTMQEIFGLKPCLRDACRGRDLADLFKPGTIPTR